ncbi:MAG: PDZ domain-containing protein [Actinobacteria bacterium]|nr:PDZ domain-containing protein [Actinomycetota bacterium]NDC52390.1 PDZ domain-containing protein [Actinomycetota bacterium]NDI24637.1 PDZ domain-containing protein [Actinomycetota bacterium]
MRPLSTFSKIMIGFVIGAVVAGGVAVAVTPTNSLTKICVDNATKALYAPTNGNCSTTRTLVDVGGSSVNVEAIAANVSPAVVSIAVSGVGGSGTGSGVIYRTNSSHSFIVTNNHVIDSAVQGGSVRVELNNGDLVNASIVGRDSAYDLAVLRINRGNLKAIAVGNSSTLTIGEPVVAFGSPLGLSGTVTSGIVSALNRPVTTGSNGAESFIDAIQTDAAINPGNSGGPLVNSKGALVGINSAIASLGNGVSAGSIGLGFSIPINQAKRVVDEIIDTGKSSRPFFGVNFDTTYSGTGARILRVVPGEAADKAGIPSGAIVREIDGKKIGDLITAIVRIRSYAPGATVRMLIELPSGSTKSFTVTFGKTDSI